MWADSRAAGVSEEDFWRCTPDELNALLASIAEREAARERAAALRAGLIASEVHNANRGNRTGGRFVYTGPPRQLTDYVKMPVQVVDGPTLRDLIHGWMRRN